MDVTERQAGVEQEGAERAVDLHHDPAAIGAARAWAAPVLAHLGVDGERDVALVVISELVTNAVFHGDGDIRVALSRHGPSVRIDVTDHGGGEPALRAERRDPTAVGGWGLRIVDAVAARWGVESDADHTTVWAEVRPG